MAKNKKKEFFVHFFPVYGSVSTGAIYVAIGAIAILALLKILEGGADEGSLLARLNDYILGQILIWAILLGMVSFIAWRFYEAFKDPYNYGSKALGIARRTGIALSSVADAFIAWSAIQVLLGLGNIQEDGEPEGQRELVGSMLHEAWGDWLIVSVGVVIMITAVVQFYYGVTKGYRERLDIAHFDHRTKVAIHVLAWVGYFARGIILGIVGFFFIRAAIEKNAELVVNTDKAFDFIGTQIGHLPFVLVAMGTICYGLFMFAMGISYDVDSDPSDPNVGSSEEGKR